MYKLLPILLFAYGLAVTTEDIYDNSYALIIGIDKYENVSNLDYAVKDANSITTLLKDNFNFPSQNIKTLLNNEATYSNVRNSLGEISTSAKENDRVLIFFAGHGQTMDLPDGGEMGYLLPVDGNKDNLFATSILMDDLKKISSMSKAKHMLFLIDACYGGLAATGSRGLSSTTPNYIDKITNDKSRQIITAGGRGEQVIEKAEWGHSAFTMNLIRALKNGKGDLNDDGYITGDELGLFLKEKVTIDSENQQTPQSRRFTSHEGEFVFINDSKVVMTDKIIEIHDDLSTIDYDKLASKIAAQIQTIGGCTNPKAMNYFPDATVDDGSCKFGKLIITVEFGQYDKANKVIPIIINNNDPVTGFQITISGAKIINGFGGIAEKVGFKIIPYTDGIIGYQLSTAISSIGGSGSQTLINLEIKPNSPLFTKVCIKETIFADLMGNAQVFDESVNNCFKP